MPDNPYGEEVVINIVVGIIVFSVVTGLLVFIILFYQKKRFQHMQQMAEKNKEYSEQLLQSQIEIQEQTFNTISNEIHDNVGQILSLAKVQLNIMDQRESLDRAMLAEAKESVSKAMTDLRDIAKSLSSDRIRKTDLCEITEQELQRINRSGIMTTTFKRDGRVINLAEQKKLIIFRMIQECLQNIIKHSNASSIEIYFHYENERLKITISDNGKGFDISRIDQNSGLGLKNLFTRAKLIDGTAEIYSNPGTGTSVTIISPYE
jgi:two-component system, NarL family, sensor kinase